MKIYEERKLNSMYLLHNLQRVADIKEGMEIIVSVDKCYHFTSSKKYNVYSEDYNINNIVPLIKDYGNSLNRPIPEFINEITGLDNILGSSLLKFKEINNNNCLILTLSKTMVDNLKNIFKENDYIAFDNLSLTNYSGEIEKVFITKILKTIAILPYLTKLHTEEEIDSFYNIVIEKLPTKKDIILDLLSGKEIFAENGRIWTKNGIEDELKQMLEIITQVEDSDDKLLTLKNIFSTLTKTPYYMFKFLGINLDENNNGIITRIFS